MKHVMMLVAQREREKVLAIRVSVRLPPSSLVAEQGLGANSESSCPILSLLTLVLAPPADELGIRRPQSLK